MSDVRGKGNMGWACHLIVARRATAERHGPLRFEHSLDIRDPEGAIAAAAGVARVTPKHAAALLARLYAAWIAILAPTGRITVAHERASVTRERAVHRHEGRIEHEARSSVDVDVVVPVGSAARNTYK